MINQLCTLAHTSDLIESGKCLVLAGAETLLRALPHGRWIAGTSVNFIEHGGGTTDPDHIFVTDLTDIATNVEVRRYGVDHLSDLTADYPEHGFTIVILPGFSQVHAAFAQDVQGYAGVFNTPLVGWVAGVPVAEIGRTSPKCFAGSPEPLANAAVAFHVSLPADVEAQVDLINLFTQNEAESIEFDANGFSTLGPCSIDGRRDNLAAFITERGIDTKLPLVADYNGAMINVSIQSVDQETGMVQFYAPVFAGIKYRFAQPVTDYSEEFERYIAQREAVSPLYSCNCILNFLYAELEGKRTGRFVGPVTFGEVAYMLLNQTLVYLRLERHA